MPEAADRAAFEDIDRKDKKSKKDGKVKKDKTKHVAEQLVPMLAPDAGRPERSATRAPVSERDRLSDLEVIPIYGQFVAAQSAPSVVAPVAFDLEAWREQAMAKMIASFNLQDALAPLKQDVVGVQVGQQQMQANLDQLFKELNAVRVSHQSQRDTYAQLATRFDKVMDKFTELRGPSVRRKGEGACLSTSARS